jgi:hypothetical protein
MLEGPGADSEEKREPVSDIDTTAMDSLKALDPNRPIREADMCGALADVCYGPCVDVYGPRPIATGRRDQVQWSQLLTYIRLLMRPDISSPRATMDFRALPPQRPLGIGRGHAGPHTRFGKRRNDRFAISCHFVAIAG